LQQQADNHVLKGRVMNDPPPEVVKQWENQQASNDPTGGLLPYLYQDDVDTLKDPDAPPLAKILALKSILTPPQWKALLKQIAVDGVLRYQPPPEDKKLPGFPDAKPVKAKGGRTTWKGGKKGDYTLQWDYQHGRVEVYDKNGHHLGEFDPHTGKQTKPYKPGRKIDK
jgi:hypothetical protein